jgi:hypothetical protein
MCISTMGINLLLFSERITFYSGFRFNTGFKKVVNAGYTDTQGNAIINTDHISTNGTYMGLVLRAGINLFSFKNPEIHLRAPHIRLPHITFRHPHKKEYHKFKYKRHPSVKSPRFILQ